jgi:hypothetical protein
LPESNKSISHIAITNPNEINELPKNSMFISLITSSFHPQILRRAQKEFKWQAGGYKECANGATLSSYTSLLLAR